MTRTVIMYMKSKKLPSEATEDLKKERQPEKDYYDKTRDSHVIDYSHNDEDSYNYNYPDRNRKKNTVRQLWHRGSPIIASGKIEH